MLMLLGLLPGVAGAQNFWEPASGPVYGTVLCIAFDSSGRVFVGTDGGGIFRSNDNGNTWSHVDSARMVNYAAGSVSDIAVSPNGHIFAASGSVIIRSTDGGDTWAVVSDSLSAQQSVRSIAISKNCHIFVAGSGGLRRSTDEGQSWIAPSQVELMVSRVAISSSGRLFVCGRTFGTSYSEIRSSVDEGITWRGDTIGQFGSYQHQWTSFFDVNDFAFHPNGHLVAATTSGIGILDTETDRWIIRAAPNGGALGQIAIDSHGVIFAAGTMSAECNLLARTSDEGLTWKVLDTGWYGINAVSPKGVVFTSVHQGGIARSTNEGDTWERIGNGINGLALTGIVITPSNHVLTFGGSTFADVLFSSSDEGMLWYSLDSLIRYAANLNSLYACVITRVGLGLDGRLSVATEGCGLFLSSDDGQTWIQNDSAMDGLWVEGFVSDPDSIIYAGTSGGFIFESIDNGKTWSKLASVIRASNIYSMVFSSDNDFLVGADSGLFRSTDKGKTWTQIALDSQYLEKYYPYVNVLGKTHNGKLFANTYNAKILASNDNGNSWFRSDSGLTCRRAYSLTINGEGIIFVGTDNGVFVSVDGGTEWRPINSGLPPSQVEHVVADSSGRIYVTTDGYGVFRSAHYSFVVNGNDAKQSHSFASTQNSPNPFTQTTTIRFTLPGAAFASIKVYDITGREVAALASKEFPAGDNEVTFDGKGLSPGVYYYRIETASGQAAGRAFVKLSEQ